MFSYHGVPMRYLHNGDPYHCECHKTSRLLAEKLGLGKDEYVTTFQSRFGREEWLKPYTDATLKAFPGAGREIGAGILPGLLR
jgi:ferrochelatase